jgi:nucleotide-binding universal stress UspA family protein
MPAWLIQINALGISAAQISNTFKCPRTLRYQEKKTMIRISRILHPTDFSKNARPALEYAGDFALRFKADLHLLNVIDNRAFTGSPAEPEFFPMEFMQDYMKDIEKQMQQLAFTGMENCQTIVREVRMGNPFIEITRFAEQRGIDLIIMGTHGRTGIGHLLVGSVAENVVRRSACPVLTVPAGKLNT